MYSDLRSIVFRMCLRPPTAFQANGAEIKPFMLSTPIELSKPTDNQMTWWMKRLIFRGIIIGEIDQGNKSPASTWLHPKVRCCGYYQMQSLSASHHSAVRYSRNERLSVVLNPCTRRGWSSHAVQHILTNYTYTSPVIWKLLSLLSVPQDMLGNSYVPKQSCVSRELRRVCYPPSQ